jgi:hypothetical protein
MIKQMSGKSLFVEDDDVVGIEMNKIKQSPADVVGGGGGDPKSSVEKEEEEEIGNVELEGTYGTNDLITEFSYADLKRFVRPYFFWIYIIGILGIIAIGLEVVFVYFNAELQTVYNISEFSLDWWILVADTLRLAAVFIPITAIGLLIAYVDAFWPPWFFYITMVPIFVIQLFQLVISIFWMISGKTSFGAGRTSPFIWWFSLNIVWTIFDFAMIGLFFYFRHGIRNAIVLHYEAERLEPQNIMPISTYKIRNYKAVDFKPKSKKE